MVKIKIRYVVEAFLVAGWFFLLMYPAIYAGLSVKSNYPSFDYQLSFRNAYLILEQMFLMPGNYYGWLLSAMGLPVSDHSLSSLAISVILYAPFFVWPFLRPEKHKFLKRLLQGATVLFVLSFVLIPFFISQR